MRFLYTIFFLFLLTFLAFSTPAFADDNQNWACNHNGDTAGAYYSISCTSIGCSSGSLNCDKNQVCDDHYTEAVTGQGYPCAPISSSILNCTCKDGTNFTCGVNGSTNDFTRSCGYGEVCDNSVLSDKTKVWPCAKPGNASVDPSLIPTGSFVNPCPNGLCTTAFGIINVSSPTDFINKVFQVLLSTSGAIALFLIIGGGYQLAISQGNPEKVKNARERLVSAIIGLLFIIFSVAILQIVGIDVLHIQGFK
ncbi:MAG: DUF308 domain-containing protein [Patescibacteria group bacterium]|nr:DUF308 domain-containing protein [Patescibacteria group bacterium]MDE2591212.1 DUF308 domain-containing protein [Patescibacteria group bacterium]